jgi:hypothetical protein
VFCFVVALVPSCFDRASQLETVHTSSCCNAEAIDEGIDHGQASSNTCADSQIYHEDLP